MPKSKDGPALFEIMRRPEARVKKKEPGTAEAQEPEPASAELPEPPAAAVDQGHAGSTERPRPDEPARPWVEVAGGQLRFALSSQALAVAIFALGLLLVGAYAIGQRIGRARGEEAGYQAGRTDTQAAVMDDIQAARAAQPTDNLFEGVGASPIVPATPASEGVLLGEPPAEASARPAWVRGYTYVVVQDFRSDALADVERAARYLLDKGIETEIVELDGDWRYRLIATRGFNRDDPVQRKLADDFLNHVRQVGEAYFQAGGRYRLEGYFKKLTADRW